MSRIFTKFFEVRMKRPGERDVSERRTVSAVEFLTGTGSGPCVGLYLKSDEGDIVIEIDTATASVFAREVLDFTKISNEKYKNNSTDGYRLG